MRIFGPKEQRVLAAGAKKSGANAGIVLESYLIGILVGAQGWLMKASLQINVGAVRLLESLLKRIRR